MLNMNIDLIFLLVLRFDIWFKVRMTIFYEFRLNYHKNNWCRDGWWNVYWTKSNHCTNVYKSKVAYNMAVCVYNYIQSRRQRSWLRIGSSKYLYIKSRSSYTWSHMRARYSTLSSYIYFLETIKFRSKLNLQSSINRHITNSLLFNINQIERANFYILRNRKQKSTIECLGYLDYKINYLG